MSACLLQQLHGLQEKCCMQGNTVVVSTGGSAAIAPRVVMPALTA
jgi:hypothetical protein